MVGISFKPAQHLFTFFMWAMAGRTTIPGFVDTPLLPPHQIKKEKEKILVDQTEQKVGGTFDASDAGFEEHGHTTLLTKDADALPIVIFSHGMAGMSQSYSYYLGSLASQGFVVAAVEHRDGSGPGSLVHLPNGKKKRVWHLKLEDLQREPPMTLSELKVAQLAFREAEILETVRLFERLNAGEDVKQLKPHSPDKSLPTFKNRLDLDAVTIAGHSYGATGTLQAIKYAPSKKRPLNGAIALDPGKESGPLNDDIKVPVLVFNSGEWTEKQVEFYGQGLHFDVEKKLVKKAEKGWFMTLLGTAHPSCTDAPLIVPWIMRLVLGTTLDPLIALKEYVDVSVEFLNFLRDGDIKGMLKSQVSSPDGPVGKAEDRGTVDGRQGGKWEVHVVPKEAQNSLLDD
jgi:platelet-activating factor acetylhydrolase